MKFNTLLCRAIALLTIPFAVVKEPVTSSTIVDKYHQDQRETIVSVRAIV